MRWMFIGAAALALAGAPAHSETLDQSAVVDPAEMALAFGPMYKRVDTATEAYRLRIGLGEEYVQYCLSLRNLFESEHNGSDRFVPFNNFDFTTRQQRTEWEIQLRLRENFLTQYTIQCYAEAAGKLKSAEPLR